MGSLRPVDTICLSNGALFFDPQLVNNIASSNTVATATVPSGIAFNATRANTLFGAADTVHPESIRFLALMRAY